MTETTEGIPRVQARPASTGFGAQYAAGFVLAFLAIAGWVLLASPSGTEWLQGILVAAAGWSAGFFSAIMLSESRISRARRDRDAALALLPKDVRDSLAEEKIELDRLGKKLDRVEYHHLEVPDAETDREIDEAYAAFISARDRLEARYARLLGDDAPSVC